ncbi:MAG: hypothetical protein AAFN74_24055 [Myxococcota bacterium]
MRGYIERQLQRQNAEAALAAVEAAKKAGLASVEVWSLGLEAAAASGRSEAVERWLTGARQALNEVEQLRVVAEHRLRIAHPMAATSLAAWRQRAPRDIDALLFAVRWAAYAKRAAPWAAQALAEAPREPRVLAAVGMVALRAGDQTRALEHLARAARLDPWNAEIAEKWGDAAAATKRWATAQRAYAAARRVLEVQPVSPGDKSGGVEGALRRLRVKQQLARKAL